MHKQIILLLVFLYLVPTAMAFDLDVLNTDPAPLIAGDYGDITIRLFENNTRYTIEDVSISLEESDHIKVIGPNEERIGYFNAPETITRTFRVFLAETIPGGTIRVSFIIDSSAGRQVIKKDIFVKDAKSLPDLAIGNIESVPDEILSDSDDNKITITLQNLGETKAEMVKAELVIETKGVDPSTSFSMQDAVSSIEGGKESELEFEFDVDETMREDIKAALNLRYRSRQSVTDTYRTFRQNIGFIIPLSKAPFLEVREVSYDKLMTGTPDNKVRVIIANTGEKEAKSVRMRMHPDISYPFIFDATTHYITSELDPGEEATLEFEIEVLADAVARTYPIAVELESLVGETLYSREDTVSVDVIQGMNVSNRSVGVMIIVTVIIVALGFGIYSKFKRKKRQ